MTSSLVDSTRRQVFREETQKIAAFARRDFLVSWSYRFAFFADWLNLLTQILMFGLIGSLIDPGRLPEHAGGGQPTYIEFVSVGIALSSFLQLGLTRSITALRNEQLMGTLESLLVTPTAPITLQLGSVAFDLAYVPVRTAVFFLLASAVFHAEYAASGLLPAALILLVFTAWVWGLGLMSAAGVMTFRRGTGVVGFGAMALVLSSTTYFPADVFPSWLQAIASVNPITVALDAMRALLIGRAGWHAVWSALPALVAAAVLAIALGIMAFRLALARERRRGSIGLY